MKFDPNAESGETPHRLTLWMSEHEACVMLGAMDSIAMAMRGEDGQNSSAFALRIGAPPQPLSNCDHRYMTSGQHVEGVRDDRVEKCVKCGDVKERT